ncbi:MAG: DUF4834 domain-containing protein [Flavobacteriaceae bacterium]|nr:DUF4834 domain-containing protein [Flavobacteriaceae bacterium]MDZ4146739.1 DUF4834 domain-containing protein [Flavobacteriaceae bacterium]
MQEASLTGLIRILLIFFVVYYAIKFLMRIFAPHIVNYLSKKVENNLKEQFKNQQQAKQNDVPPKEKKKDNLGEYIDYEEVE